MMENDCKEKIEIIKSLLLNRNNLSEPPGLMGGRTGELLFLVLYYEFTHDDRILDIVVADLERILDSLDYKEIGYSYSYGFSGIGWFIDVLKKKNYIDNDSDEIYGKIDDLIFKHSLTDLLNGNYDYLSGALGAGLYFAKKELPSIKYLTQYIKVINQIKIEDSDSCFLFEKKKNQVNLGLSHGLPSIISFLCICYRLGVEREICKNLIKGFVAFVVKNMRETNGIRKTYFPYSTSDLNMESRLAWCYGDLSTGYILHEASLLLEDLDLERLSIQVLKSATNRKRLTENLVFDAGICHGSSGIAHIFGKLAKSTDDDIFKEAFTYWYEQTIMFGNNGNFSGYNFFFNREYCQINGFLEGNAGVGAFLLSNTFQISQVWEECLLIS